MLNLKKHTIVFLLILFCKTSFSQNWNLNIFIYNDSLEVELTTDEYIDSFMYFSFNNNVLEQNAKSNIRIKDKQLNQVSEIKEQIFKINPKYSNLSYSVYYSAYGNVTTQAYINYLPLKYLNLNEILFNTSLENAIFLSINVFEENHRYSLGRKSIKDWKLDPIKLIQNHPILVLNNIKFYSNLKSFELIESLQVTFVDFKYMLNQSPKEVVLIFANDSLSSGGASFNDLAIIYVDTGTIKNPIIFSIQKTILHEVFHWVSPYNIHSEKDGINIDKNWLAEATPEYLSLKYMLSHKLITEKKFLLELELKMRKANSFNNYSLHDMSIDIYRHPFFYEAFYSKGTLALWLLEIKMLHFTNGKITFFDLITGNLPKMDAEANLALNNMLFELEENLVNSKGKFDYNNYLKYLSLEYHDKIFWEIKESDTHTSVKEGSILFNNEASLAEKKLWLKFVEKED